MPREVATAKTDTVSDLLAELDLHGQTWCYSDLGDAGGFSLPSADAVLFHAVLHGSARIACGGGEIAELGPGDAVMVLSGEAHALRTRPGSSAITHQFLKEDRAVDIPPTIPLGSGGPIKTRVLSGRLHATWPGDAGRASLPSILRFNLREEGNAATALIRPDALPQAGMGAGSAALLTRLASLLLVAGLRSDPSCRRLFSPAPRDPITEAMRLIEANPSASWTVEKLARSVGMGRSNFAAHFTQQVGRAPMEVVAECRMDHAATLLRQGKLKVAEISEMAGYGSEAAFSRRFTRHFGITPSQMRQNAQKDRDNSEAATNAFLPLLSSRLIKDTAAMGRRSSVVSELPVPSPSPDKSILMSQASFLLRGKRD